MQVPTAAQLIGVWERGAGQHWVDRALILLSAAYPELQRAELAALTVGERDARLLALHERLFGGALKSLAECPSCRTRLEFSIDTKDLRGSFVTGGNAAPTELLSEGIRLMFRPLSSQDLQAATLCADVTDARRVLMERCILDAQRDGERLGAADLPEGCIEDLASSVAALDGGADMLLDLECVSCRHAWRITLDIVTFLWAEISSLAKRYLNEVHTLAWAYGWREADILAMSPVRRRFYLERAA